MTSQQILDLANERYTELGEWRFTKLGLLAFAQSVIEAEREKRKPLTDEEIRLIVRDLVPDVTVAESVMFRDVARAIERRINGEEE